MPGDRLTIEDRRHIAMWLDEGLGYAAIARWLARPTSTISREVARNGGRQGYRADQAQQDTARRARRSAPAPAPATPPEADEDGRDVEAVRDFEQQFVSMMVRTGFPPMPARVLACLFMSDSGCFTVAGLVQRLQVSPASVSKAIGYLEKLDLVSRERDTQHRRERYLVHEDAWYRAWFASVRSIAMWAEATQRGVEVLGAATSAGTRLQRTSHFFEVLGEDMAAAAEHRRQTLWTSAPGAGT
ncbi:GbsR/MarR family transcriptional regulator [Amycolatopsis taiwanensis]|uniref:GbsR/MarR family transcriptional regulator n=1 Tax=Amycolatopsis taiwanensis TaxID=342230 RepID=UPI0004ADE898|nr:helix-turn-helix domain-containing protein [Amycolatopsis taiwanensis]